MKKLNEYLLKDLWNEYCEDMNDVDSMIYDMDEFDEIMDGFSPSEIADQIFYGDFNPSAHYFKFDGRGNLQSGEEVEDLAYLEDSYFIEWSESR